MTEMLKDLPGLALSGTRTSTRRARPPMRLPEDRTPAEELSFKLFDGQSLQYTDKTQDGLYDVWGVFEGVEDNMQAQEFPSLESLRRMSYKDGQSREVIVFDKRHDVKLKELTAEALKTADQLLKSSGAMTCAQKLSSMVASHLGGSCQHSKLSARYSSSSAALKQRKGTFVMHIGELAVGASRHRALLLKWLADACDLPCRLVRGDFYLGSAGTSGEVSVAILNFNGHEWMVELVTEPGRLFRIHARETPDLSRSQLWDGRTPRDDPGVDSTGRMRTTTSGFPTVPTEGGRESEEAREEDSSSSGGLREGLQWSDHDGPTMDDLGQSEGGGMSQEQSTDHAQQQASFKGQGSNPAQSHAAIVGSNLSGLQARQQAKAQQTAKTGQMQMTDVPTCLEGQPSSYAPTDAGSEGNVESSVEAQAKEPVGSAGREAEQLPTEVLRDDSFDRTQSSADLCNQRQSKSMDARLEPHANLRAEIRGSSLNSKLQDQPGQGEGGDREPRGVSNPASTSGSSKPRGQTTSSNEDLSTSGSSVGRGQTVATEMNRISRAKLARLRELGRAVPGQSGKKEYLSSDSTFYDMQSMASTLFDEAARLKVRDQAEVRRDSSSTGDPSPDTISAQERHYQNEVDIDFSEVELGPRIGIGCFGEVFKARWRRTTVAVKRLIDQSLSEQSLKEFRAEVQLCQQLKHPNIILFMGACTTPPNLSIVTQFAPRGSLFHLLHSPSSSRPNLSIRQKLKMALDIARGMHYLHSAKPPVIHRDLKSMNLLVDNDLTIKVCDFGLARIRSSTWMSGKSQGGTPEWTAPEVLRNLQYNEKSDVYSYGVVLYELASEKEPWDEMSPMQVVGAVGWAGNRLQPPEDCLPIFASLMTRCFQDNFTERPSFADIMQELVSYAQTAT